jgi:hypothetical protein
MKSLTLKLLVPALFVASCAHLQARFVTLTLNRTDGGPDKPLAELTIQSNEIATIRSSIGWFYLNIIKDGSTGQLAQANIVVPGIIVIAGPAVFQFLPSSSVPQGFQGFCTIEIAPESFPPDKTLIIPQGTGANITFECSTNLLDWAPVWQGTYTNAPSNKFFRIRADRLP